jgi:hypothetical protein
VLLGASSGLHALITALTVDCQRLVSVAAPVLCTSFPHSTHRCWDGEGGVRLPEWAIVEVDDDNNDNNDNDSEDCDCLSEKYYSKLTIDGRVKCPCCSCWRPSFGVEKCKCPKCP